MNIALGQWIANLANRQARRTGEESVQALSWALEWVDVKQGAYHALGSPYGDHDDGLLRWLDERNPLPPDSAPVQAEHTPNGPRAETGNR